MITTEQKKIDDGFEIVFVIDRSGSMGGSENDVIGGFNTFVAQQKKDGGSKLSMVQFDTTYGDPAFWRKPIEEVKELDRSSFVPRGGTALFDAIGKSISRMKEWQSKGEVTGKVMFVIQTDGEENASSEIITRDQLIKLIDDAKNNLGWEFTFLGAGIDAFSAGGGLGISLGSTVSSTKVSGSMSNSYKFANSNTRAYRSSTEYDSDLIGEMQRATLDGDESLMDTLTARADSLVDQKLTQIIKPDNKDETNES